MIDNYNNNNNNTNKIICSDHWKVQKDGRQLFTVAFFIRFPGKLMSLWFDVWLNRKICGHI